MPGLLDFDAKQLDTLVDRHGLRQAWLNILATSIKNRSDLTYILEDELFLGCEDVGTDLLKGMPIGEIGVLYEYCTARADADSKWANGQFYTPDDAATFMVSKTLDFPSGKWLDPCSGIGNLSWHLVNAQQSKEDFLVNSLVLSDKDELALIIARVLLTASFQNKRELLFHEIEHNFIVFDFLSIADDHGQVGLSGIPDHDFVIVNPPYRATRREDTRFETARSRDLYAYFLENIIKTSKGFVSITPQSFTNARKFTDLRRLLLESKCQLMIYNFDNIPGNIFYGMKFGSKNSNKANSTRAAVTVASPTSGTNKITSLVRWRSAEREEMFGTVDHFLSETALTADFFPKVSSVFESLYVQLSPLRRLSDLISQKPTDYVLHIPASPRYFISALKFPVSRTSQRTLYFRSADDLDTAYLVLNSSLMYWWWRVRDGGMTLSLESLKSVPVPAFETDSHLVRELEASERTNRVYKRNAGVNQENVKHSAALISRLNYVVIPEYSEQVSATHENTELAQLRFLEREDRQNTRKLGQTDVSV